MRVWYCKYGDARLEPQHQNSYQNIEPSEICIKSELGTLVSRPMLDLDLLLICELIQSLFDIPQCIVNVSSKGLKRALIREGITK